MANIKQIESFKSKYLRMAGFVEYVQQVAKLIRDLLKRFPKARILGHRDLPGVRKACPCYDVAKDLDAEKLFQDLKNLPRIRDRPLHRGQKREPDPRDIYARCAEA